MQTRACQPVDNQFSLKRTVRNRSDLFCVDRFITGHGFAATGTSVCRYQNLPGATGFTSGPPRLYKPALFPLHSCCESDLSGYFPLPRKPFTEKWPLVYFACSRRGDRAAEGARQEIVCTERYRGFESPPLRHASSQSRSPVIQSGASATSGRRAVGTSSAVDTGSMCRSQLG